MEYEVTTLNDEGYGSFRYGIENSKRGTKIIFSVCGTIVLKGDLPEIRHAVYIQGYDNIKINCDGFGGLVLGEGSSGSVVKLLYLYGAKNAGLTIRKSNKNQISLCTFLSNENGILLDYSRKNELFRNILSNNRDDGLVLIHSNDNEIKTHYIGVDSKGNEANSNEGNGIYMYKSNHNTIGGTSYGTNNPTGSKGTTTPTFVVPYDGNLISGNRKNGIFMDKCIENTLYGNFIGTDNSGNTEIGNGLNGVFLNECSKISFVGCSSVQNPFVYYNIMSGNKRNGLRITNSDHIVIHGNFFGVAANNQFVLPNNENGILIDGKSNHIQIGYYIPLGNVISGNRLNGIYITEEATNVISYNTFGGLAAFGLPLPNLQSGIKVDSTNEGIIIIRTCVLSGNRKSGIYLKNTKNVFIDSVICGLSTDGAGFLPNEEENVLIVNSERISIISHAKSVIFSSNVFGGAHGAGIRIQNSHHIRIKSCFVGVNILGNTAFPNYNAGIAIIDNSHDVEINSDSDINIDIKQLKQIDQLSIENSDFYLKKTNTPIDEISEAVENIPNIISGNDIVGILLDSTTHDNIIVNNYIGYGIQKNPIPNFHKQIDNKGKNNAISSNLIYKS